ncbi:MAG: LytTR family transcriptional regulator DNA-binding domain-containing protein [Crocinitomicaceae bacterium]
MSLIRIEFESKLDGVIDRQLAPVLFAIISFVYLIFVRPGAFFDLPIVDLLTFSLLNSFSAFLACYFAQSLVSVGDSVTPRRLLIFQMILFLFATWFMCFLCFTTYQWVSESVLSRATSTNQFLIESLELFKFWFVLCLFVVITLVIPKWLKDDTLIEKVYHSIDGEIDDSYKEASIEISGRNKNEILKCRVEDIIYVKSNGHYVKILFQNEGGIKNVVFRNSIANISQQLRNQNCKMLRSAGRSLLINRSKVISVDPENKQVKLDGVFQALNVPEQTIRKIQQDRF